MKKPNTSRRKFIKNSLLVGVGLPLISQGLYSCVSNSHSKKLNILILGGTSFLGPHQIAYALERGHSVSIFTRGKTKPKIHTEAFDKVEHLIGDREDNLKALENRSWDVVIDNSGRRVHWTEKTAKLLKDTCGLYLYISSTGVFFPYGKGDLKETDKVFLKTPEDAAEGGVKMSYDYGVMKANSEVATKKIFGEDRSIIVRPTYMYGPGDRTDRFLHWSLRLPKGGDVMVPGKQDDPVQFIDVRDIAEFCIHLAENKSVGTYNGAGPAESMTIAGFANKAKTTFKNEVNLIHVDDENFLKENNIYYILPWMLPDEYNYGSARVNNQKAKEKGLKFRDIQTSLKDIHDWWYSDAVSEERRLRVAENANSPLNREAAILQKWKAFKEQS